MSPVRQGIMGRHPEVPVSPGQLRPETETMMAIKRDGPPDRERPTLPELMAAAAELPPSQAARVLARARPAPSAPPASPSSPAPPVVYDSWDDFLAKTTRAGRRAWCAAKAKKANAPRLMSGRPASRITPHEVLKVLEGARTLLALRLARGGEAALKPRRVPDRVGARRSSYRIAGPCC
jgi:hypothetical protein